jgi:hypothetical protein
VTPKTVYRNGRFRKGKTKAWSLMFIQQSTEIEEITYIIYPPILFPTLAIQ